MMFDYFIINQASSFCGCRRFADHDFHFSFDSGLNLFQCPRFEEDIERNLPEGVALVVSATERQALPDHLKEGGEDESLRPADLSRASPIAQSQ